MGVNLGFVIIKKKPKWKPTSYPPIFQSTSSTSSTSDPWLDSASKSWMTTWGTRSSWNTIWCFSSWPLSPWDQVDICFIPGYLMTFLMQPEQMGANKSLWVSWHHLKLLVTLILFMPVYKFLPILSTGIVTARFFWLVALVFLSPMAKYYREHYSRLAQVKTQWYYDSHPLYLKNILSLIIQWQGISVQ